MPNNRLVGSVDAATTQEEVRVSIAESIRRAWTTIQSRGYKTYFEDMDKPRKEYKPADEVSLRNGGIAKFKDCVQIDGSFFLLKDDNVTKDYFREGEYCLKSSSDYLITSFDKNGKMDTRNPSYYFKKYGQTYNNIVQVNDGISHQLADYNKIPKEFYLESVADNIFYHNSVSRYAVLDKQLKTKGRKATNIYKPSWDRKDLKKDYEMGVISPSFVKTEGKRYSFGLELETISGILPIYVDDYLNYLSIRDGSLKDEDGNEYGLEYVSGVLIGDTGLLQAKRLCNELTKRCIVNKKCGVHVHLGGTKFNNELVVYLYKLCLIVEKELFNMMPLSRRKNEYCKKLKPINMRFTEEDLNDPSKYNSLIEEYYTQIYTYVSATGELPSSKANKKTQHPLGAKCGYNHNTARYCWMNFVPTIFDTRGNGHNTIENRLMAGSTNFNKVKNWILLNMGLLWFAENHKRLIALNQDITLSYIMELAYPKNHMEIVEYIQLRTSKFSSDDVETNKRIELSDYKEVVESNDLTIKNL